ncbi:MAG: NAD(P)H-dependent oxidoreductase subunit E [Oscillospiraceae bacterium]
MKKYTAIIDKALAEGGLLDAFLALQAKDGYLSEDAMRALAEKTGDTPAHIYDTASFYGMLRFEKPCPVEIKICHGTSCHSAGNAKLVSEIEKLTGAELGGVSPDGTYSLSYVECLGQCNAAPSMLINGTLYTNVDPEKLADIIKGGVK